MHTTSTLYNEILAGDHRTEVKAEINGTIYGIDTIVSMQTSRAVFGDQPAAAGQHLGHREDGEDPALLPDRQRCRAAERVDSKRNLLP